MRMKRGGFQVILSLLLASASWVGCGGSPAAAVAVRVAGMPIERSAVAHWTKVVRSEAAIATWLARPLGTAREKALDVLISMRWLIGEAAKHGLDVAG